MSESGPFAGRMPRRTLRSRLGPDLEAKTGAAEAMIAYTRERNRPLILLGKGLFIFLTASLALPLTIRNTQMFTSGYILMSLLFTVLVIFATRSFVRLVFPVSVLLIMQVWILVCYMIVSPELVPDMGIGRHLYWPTLVVLPYFVLGSICILDPSYRHQAVKVLFWFCMVNAMVGILQFVRVPGFADLQRYYAPGSFGVDWYGNTPNLYRVVGLSLHPFYLAAECLFGMALVGSNLLNRRLFPREVVSITVFLLALFMAQSRAYYASGAVVVVVLLVLLFRRDKVLFTWSLGFMAFAVIVIGALFATRLEYATQGQGIAESGRLKKWQAASKVVLEYPITGVGPNANFFGNERDRLPDRRGITYTENGYLMIASTGGIPGLAILVFGLIGTFLVSLKVAITKQFEPHHRRMGLVGALYVFSVAVALGITNVFEAETLTYFGMAAAAIGVTDVGKAFSTRRRSRSIGYGFSNGPSQP